MNFNELINKAKACIFDMDGTLVDSLNIWKDIDKRFFLEHNMELPSDYDKRIAHMSFMEMAYFTKEEYNIKEDANEIASTWLQWSKEAYENTIQLKPYALELLRKLYDMNIPLSLATTNDESLYLPCLKRLDIIKYFKYIDNVNRLNTTKKEPKIYLHLSNKMKTKPEETIVFEDILMALTSAKEAGFLTCGVYDKANIKDMEKIIEKSDCFIENYKEVI